ncbi:MAG: hypothetical protein AABY15_01075 [Nanoarchaeota archaeon]
MTIIIECFTEEDADNIAKDVKHLLKTINPVVVEFGSKEVMRTY